jgi:uncharacterized membrane protein
VLANSVAVIIGAVVMAPLTPVFGLALALVRGDAKLLGRALHALGMGVILAVGISAIFGSLPLALEITPEMLSHNLSDTQNGGCQPRSCEERLGRNKSKFAHMVIKH